MDPTTEHLSDHAWRLTYDDLSPETVHQVKRTLIVEEPAFSRRYPAESCTRIDVTTTDGRRLTAETSHPKGHPRNPLTDREVEGGATA
jgi:2-methylcitrate dehydratase